MKDLYIIGAGGFGREVIWLVERINKVTPTWNIVGFLDDAEDVQNTVINGHEVLGGCDYLQNISEACWAVCTIGASKTRRKVVEKIKAYSNVKFPVLIDPSVVCSDLVQVGEGTIICAGTIVTVNISIGKHVILNLDCTVGHDAVLHDYVTVYPSVNISGNVVAEECVELGTGTLVIQGKRIEQETIVGAGAVVVKDIPAKCTAVGVPAKPIKFLE